MSAELSIVNGLIAVMLLYLVSALKFGEEDTHQSLALFLYLLAVVMSFAVIGAVVGLINNNTPYLSGMGAGTWWAVVVGGGLIIMYFIFRAMISPMLAAKKKKRFEIKD